MLSLDKLSKKKKKRKEKKSSGAAYYERGIERQMNVITCCIHNSFNCYYCNVLQLNDDPTKKI